MSVVQERYNPFRVASGATIHISGNNVGGFLCDGDGTIALVANAYGPKPETTLIPGLPVVAGVYYPMPFYLGPNGGRFVSTGATGCLGV